MSTATMPEQTLTNEQIEQIAQKVVEKLNRQFEVQEKPRTMTVSEAATAIGKSREAVYYHLNQGNLVPVPDMKPIRVWKQDVDRIRGL